MSPILSVRAARKCLRALQYVGGPENVEAIAELERALAPRRIRASKKTAAERRSWDEIKREVFERAQGRCELVFAEGRCQEDANDGHHVFGKSHESVSEVLAVCRLHHDATTDPIDPAGWWGRIAYTLKRLHLHEPADRAWAKAHYLRAKSEARTRLSQRNAFSRSTR